jgi:hypothetical protein
MAARRPVADYLSAEDKAGADPDYLFFLSHFYDDGAGGRLELPATDGVSPPTIILYGRGQPVADPAAGAGIAEGDASKDEPESSVVIDPPSPTPTPPSKKAKGATSAPKK